MLLRLLAPHRHGGSGAPLVGKTLGTQKFKQHIPYIEFLQNRHQGPEHI